MVSQQFSRGDDLVKAAVHGVTVNAYALGFLGLLSAISLVIGIVEAYRRAGLLREIKKRAEAAKLVGVS